METVEDLSWDQKLLLQMCASVSSGHCPANVAQMKPGPVPQARWLTTAIRVLRYHMAESKPSAK